MSDGERLRRALTELGTTWVKFGQMLSLRPDVVGDDVAAELAKLQATVAPDPPGVAQALVERELGGAVSDLYRRVRPGADGVRVGRAGSPGDTARRDGGGGEGAPRWRGAPRARGSRAHGRRSRRISKHEDPGIAQLRPTVIVSEFSQMLHDAIDLSQELRNLQRFTAELRRRTRHRHPDAVSRTVAAARAHDEPDLGRAVQPIVRASRRRDGTSTRSCVAPPRSTSR